MATRGGSVSYRPGTSFERLHPRGRGGRFRDKTLSELKKMHAAILAGNRGKWGAQVTGGDTLDDIEAEFRHRGLTIRGEKPETPKPEAPRPRTQEEIMRRAFGEKKYAEIERKLAREKEITAKPEAERTTGEKLELLKVGQPAYGMHVSVYRTGEDEYEIREPRRERYGYGTYTRHEAQPMTGTREQIAAEIDRATAAERQYLSERSRRNADMSLRGGKDPFKGRVTLNLDLVPSDWAVEHGYADWRDTREKGLAYKSFHWKPGSDPERVVVHYLGGRKPPENFPEGSRGAQQFTWHKVKGKKAEREKLLRKIVAALLARQQGNPAKADRLLREADRIWREAEPEGEPLVEATVPTYIERLHPRDRLGRWRDVPGVKVRKGVAYFPSFESAREMRDQLPGSRIVNYERGYAVQLARSGAYVGPEADEDTRLHLPSASRSERRDIRGPRAGDRPGQAAAATASAEQARQTAARLRAQGNEEHARDYDEMATRFDARATRLGGSVTRSEGVRREGWEGVPAAMLPVEHRRGYRSSVEKGSRGWVLWREAENRPRFPTYFKTRAEAEDFQRRSEAAAVPRSEGIDADEQRFRTRLASELTQLDERMRARPRAQWNPQFLGLAFQAVRDEYDPQIAQGVPREDAFAETFTPSREMHRVAKRLGLNLDVQGGRWVQPGPPRQIRSGGERLEGPFTYRSGWQGYYDPGEGRYLGLDDVYMPRDFDPEIGRLRDEEVRSEGIERRRVVRR